MNAETNSTVQLDEAGREILTVDRALGGAALSVAVREIVDGQREGDGLVLTLVDGRIIVVQDFYAVEVAGGAVLLALDGFGNLTVLDVSEEGDIERLERNGSVVSDMVAGEVSSRDDSESAEKVSLARLEEMFGLHGRQFDAFEEAAWDERVFRQAEDAGDGQTGGGQSGAGGGGGFLGLGGGGVALIGGVVLAAALAGGGGGGGSGGGGSPNPGGGGGQNPGDQNPGGGGGQNPGDQNPGGGGGQNPGDQNPGGGGGPDSGTSLTPQQALSHIIDPNVALTVELAEAAGLEGVRADNSANQDTLLANLNKVLEVEFGSIEGYAGLGRGFEERLQQVQSLIRSVNELVDESATIRRAVPGSLLLEIDDQSDGDVDRVVYIEQTDAYLPAEVRTATAPDQGSVNVEAIESRPSDRSLFNRIEKFEFNEQGNLVSKTIDDSGTAGVAVDGSADTIVRYRAPSSQAAADKTRIADPNLRTETERLIYEDATGDGTVDRLEKSEFIAYESATPAVDRVYTYVYSGNDDKTPDSVEIDNADDGIDGGADGSVRYHYHGSGGLARIVEDTDGDGNVDERAEYAYAQAGLGGPGGYVERERVSIDSNDDGTFDTAVTYHYDSLGSTTREDSDTDADGTIDERTYYTYAAAGYVAREKVSTDSNDDGTFDAAVTFYYDDDVSEYGYALYDGGGAAGAPDGTGDWLEFADGEARFLTLTPALAAQFAGIGTIDLADDAGTNDGATTITISDAALTTLAGGAGSYQLVINGESDDTVAFGEGISATGRTVSGGKEFQGTDGTVLVETAVTSDLLATILRNPSAATAEMFAQAGITGVHSNNLENVRAIIGAFDSSTTPARDSLTRDQVQGIVDLIHQYLQSVLVESVSWAGRVLMIDVGIDRLDITLSSDFTVQGDVWRSDLIRIGSEGDGIYNYVYTDADSDNTRESIAYDPNNDGTVEYTLRDGTGTDDEDGTYDLLEFTDGAAYNLVLNDYRVEDFQGITRVSLGRGIGLRSVQIDDAVLTQLADRDGNGTPDSGFRLTVEGVDGTVVFSDDQIQSTADPNAPVGYDVWQGSDGTVLVVDALNVFVATAVDAQGTTQEESLSRILRNLNAATAEMFAQSGINGVTLANLEIVKAAIGAFSASTIPTRESLTMEQVQGLVEIVRNIVGNSDLQIIVESTSWGGGVLALDFSSEGVSESSVIRYERVLNTVDFSVQSLVVRVDNDVDGTYETVVTDADGDGNYASSTHDPNDDGTIEYSMIDSTRNGDGTLDTLEFADGIAYSLVLDRDSGYNFQGIDRINLGSGTGLRRVQINDAGLTSLADRDEDGTPDTNYKLTIDGTDGTLVIGDDLIQFTTDPNTPMGYEALSGTDGIIYLKSNINVDSVQERHLREILDNIGSSGVDVAKFDSAGISGVEVHNLVGVKEKISAFGSGTVPKRVDLTHTQVQRLVDIETGQIASGPYSGFEGGIASWSGGVLTLEHVSSKVDLILSSEFMLQGVIDYSDSDYDGTYDWVETDADWDSMFESIAFDPNNDGTIEYTLRDDAGTSNEDGTADTLELADGVTYELILDDSMLSLIQMRWGVTRIDLGSGTGQRSLQIDDEVLTQLADQDGNGAPDGDFSLTIDGSAGAVVIGDDQIQPTTDADTPMGYVALGGTHGIIYVDSDLDIDFEQGHLQVILDDLGSNGVDVTKFVAAGITGVTSANLDVVKLVIGAWDNSSTPARVDLTQSQVQNLVEIATDAQVTVGGTVEAARLNLYTVGERTIETYLVLDINTDADAFVDQEVRVTLNSSTLEPAELWRSSDADDDGTRGDRTEMDRDYDGTYEFVDVDADEDSISDSFAFDPNDDGTVEFTHRDDTGTDDDDGKYETLEFADDVAYNLVLNPNDHWFFDSFTRINLGSGAGLRSLQIDDAALTKMADRDFDGSPDSGFILTIDGVDGTVVFGDDQIQSTTDPSAPQGYDVWRGTDGAVLVADALNVLVATSVTVQGTTQEESLSAVLQNLNAATALMFAQSGINGVTLANLENVKATIGAFDSSTTPARESLMQEQVQGLVNIVHYFENLRNLEGVSFLPESVDSASWAQGVLTLGYSIEGTDITILWHERALNLADFSVQSLIIRYGLNAEGPFTAEWTDADGDGFDESVAIDPNFDGTVEYTLLDGMGTGDEDGTLDTLEFTSGVAHHLDLGFNHDIPITGITRINLGSGLGMRSLYIDDETLTQLADRDEDGTPDSNYRLTIDGQAGRVVLGGDLIRTADDPNTPFGYQTLSGSHGVIYVDPDLIIVFE